MYCYFGERSRPIVCDSVHLHTTPMLFSCAFIARLLAFEAPTLFVVVRMDSSGTHHLEIW